MGKFFNRNIDKTGRVIRLIWGLALLVGAAFAWKVSLWLSLGLSAFALFAFFEALRGWCLVRACGIKTKY